MLQVGVAGVAYAIPRRSRCCRSSRKSFVLGCCRSQEFQTPATAVNLYILKELTQVLQVLQVPIGKKLNCNTSRGTGLQFRFAATVPVAKNKKRNRRSRAPRPLLGRSCPVLPPYLWDTNRSKSFASGRGDRPPGEAASNVACPSLGVQFIAGLRRRNVDNLHIRRAAFSPWWYLHRTPATSAGVGANLPENSQI